MHIKPLSLEEQFNDFFSSNITAFKTGSAQGQRMTEAASQEPERGAVGELPPRPAAEAPGRPTISPSIIPEQSTTGGWTIRTGKHHIARVLTQLGTLIFH